MKRNFVSRSAFFNPRVLISFTLCSLGLLVAILAFTTFPSTTVYAVPGTCADVTFEDHTETYGGPVYVKLKDTTSNCVLFYRINSAPVPCPAHSGPNAILPTQIYPSPTPFEGLGVPRGTERYITAIAYKANASPTEDSACTDHYVDNRQL
jgi:hypothetical protein